MADMTEGSVTIADRAFSAISNAILSGELPQGSKISEPELSRKLGISRGPLREAIRRLEERKLVTSLPRLGARVVELTPARLSEIYTIREALEGISAREAARHITAEEIENLRSLLRAHGEQLERADGSMYAQGLADDDFHFAIARYSRNETLFRLLCDEYYQLIRLFRQQHKVVSGRARRAYVEHCRILDALADHDCDLAELLMRRHISAARQGMEQTFAAAAAAAVVDLRSRARRRRA